MKNKHETSTKADSIRALQENVTRAAPAMAASYSLIGAIFLFGAIGYAVDRWQGTRPWFLLAGLLFGVGVGFYELIKATHRK